jgi:hypothetical protein
MWLDIETLTDDPRVDNVPVEVRPGRRADYEKLGRTVFYLFEVYDPLAVHIIKPLRLNEVRHGKDKG